MAKYDHLSNQLRERIMHGDYALRGLPAERQLATDHGVSYMTVRKALQQLIDNGILVRGTNGRVEVDRSTSKPGTLPPVALLSPAFNSAGFERWRSALDQCMAAFPARLRHILYTHWDDPVILESLENFSGVFLLSGSEEIPEALAARLQAASGPLVLLDEDLSRRGIPSIRQFGPGGVQDLLDHVETLGIGSLDCLNVQPFHSVIEDRIDQWRVWAASHQIPGTLINEPVESYTQPFTRGYDVMQRRLQSHLPLPDALFCVTTPAAVGAMRALHEAGIRPGRDLAVCAVDGEGLAEFQVPSLTTLEAADVRPQITICLRWMLEGGGAWRGPLLLQPAPARVAVRESTVAPGQGSADVAFGRRMRPAAGGVESRLLRDPQSVLCST